MISIIAAHSNNFVIGNNNTLPWHIPEDLKWFKQLTTGHPVIMGKNTFISIYDRLGKPLPNRCNIVISSTLQPTEGVEICSSLDEAIKLAGDDPELFIIGGEQLYRAALADGHVGRMYITHVDAEIEGDAFFPEYNTEEWSEVDNQPGESDGYSYKFITYERIKR